MEDEDKELLEDEEDAADEVEADEDCEENEMANISLDDDEEETGGKFHVPQELEVPFTLNTHYFGSHFCFSC